MGSLAGLVEKVEMIGECEIYVLLLPEMSKAELAWRGKKHKQFPMSCPQAAQPLLGCAIGLCSTVATLAGKVLSIMPFGLSSGIVKCSTYSVRTCTGW
jgi:hypothetical protein